MRPARLSHLCFVLWLSVVWPEGVKCASAMVSHDAPRSWTPSTPLAAFSHLRLHGRRAGTQTQAFSRGALSIRAPGYRTGAPICPTSTALGARRPPRGGLASLCMQSNKLPGGGDGIFKTVEQTFKLVKVRVPHHADVSIARLHALTFAALFLCALICRCTACTCACRCDGHADCLKSLLPNEQHANRCLSNRICAQDLCFQPLC